MPATLARVVFQLSSGLPEDRIVNDFAFNGDATSSGVRDSIEANLIDFYNTSGATYDSIGAYMSNEVLRTADASEIVFYDIQSHLDGDGTGSPVETRTWTLDAAAAATAMPQEVALCLSFHASYTGLDEIEPLDPPGPEGDLHPRARRRGRVFLGPWGTAQGAAPRPQLALLTAVTDAAFRLDDTSGPGGSGNWCVWSRKSAALFPVTTAWADNAWDTQRRRGVAPTSRVVAF